MAAVLNHVVLDQLGKAQDNKIVSVGSNEGKIATENLGWMRSEERRVGKECER